MICKPCAKAADTGELWGHNECPGRKHYSHCDCRHKIPTLWTGKNDKGVDKRERP